MMQPAAPVAIERPAPKRMEIKRPSPGAMKPPPGQGQAQPSQPQGGLTLMDRLRGGIPASVLEQIMKRNGPNPTSAMVQSDVNRGAIPGAKNAEARRSPAELAQIDRYTWGAQAGLGGLPAAAYSEFIKVPAVQGMMRPVSRALSGLAGIDQKQVEGWTDTNETSSPASWGNIGAYAQGAFSPQASSSLGALMDMFRRKQGA
jgi:hypothetical protein